MLPDGFQWIQSHQHEHGPPGALALGDVQVARMLGRLDGSWFVRLDCHMGMAADLVLQDCSSFESGRRGTEVWAVRHEARIRAEVAAKIASRTRHLACPRL